MRIFIDNSGYDLLNVGDVAMLQVLVNRLNTRFPEARLYIPTNSPARLSIFCPKAHPVEVNSREILLGAPISARMRFHPRLSRTLATYERHLRRRKLQATNFSAQRYNSYSRVYETQHSITSLSEALRSADIVLGSGGGYLTDAFGDHALQLLNTIRFAQEQGRVTALMGQGIGPLKGRRLQQAAREALPQLNLIALREGRYSEPVSRELGVRADRIVVTGDDAITLVGGKIGETLSHQGHFLGINVRVSYYSGAAKHLDALRSVLHSCARELKAPLQGVPISTYEHENDATHISRMLEGLPDTLLAPRDCFGPPAGPGVTTPEAAIARVQTCRAVVTGSYHAGVFALSSGIPIVGIAASDYYAAKFHGLRDQFGEGCAIVTQTESDWPERLRTLLVQKWHCAEEERDALRQSTQRQIAAADAAYARLFSIMGSACNS